MGLQVGVPFTLSGGLQGGGGAPIQGSSPVIQGSSPNLQPAMTAQQLQPTVNPQDGGNYSFAPAAGGGGGGTAPAAAPVWVDPYAGTVFGSTAGYQKAVGDYNATKDSTMNSITDAIGAGGGKYNSSILDYLDQRKMQRNAIDSDAVQNELSREQGMQGILDMVGNGVRSSGTILANKNAGSSSAGEAIAHAYGTLGRQQATGVGNQFAQGQDKIATEENNLTLADATQTRHAGEDKTNTINDIVNSARSQLAALNQAAQYASLPDRVDIEGKIAEIKQQAMDALTKYDGVLSGGISGQVAMDPNGVRAKANGLLTAGTAPEHSFDFTTQFPAQFQDTGQFASNLPIFIAPKKQQQQIA